MVELSPSIDTHRGLQAKILYGAPTPAPNPRRVRLEPAGGNFVASATYTMADIRLVSTVDFAAWIGLEMLVALAQHLRNVASNQI